MRTYINIHHNTSIRNNGYYCDLYAYGKRTPLLGEEYMEYICLESKPDKQKAYIEQIHKKRIEEGKIKI